MNEDTNKTLEPIEKKNSMLIPGIVAVVLVLGGVFLLMNKSNTPTSTDNSTSMATNTGSSTPQASASVEGTETTAMTAQGDTITVEAGSFYYKPAEIRVKKGQKVKIVLSSVDMMHDFNIDELNVKIPVTKSGSQNTVEFTPEKTGTFEYYCSVGQHRKMGQIGKIIVE